jgi:hypothetical protein
MLAPGVFRKLEVELCSVICVWSFLITSHRSYGISSAATQIAVVLSDGSQALRARTWLYSCIVP